MRITYNQRLLVALFNLYSYDRFSVGFFDFLVQCFASIYFILHLWVICTGMLDIHFHCMYWRTPHP